MRALVCAATGTERSACQRGVDGRHEVLLVGVGARHARAALLERLAASKPELIVSTGFAGAVASHLHVGEWVTTARFDARVAPPPAVTCALFSVDKLALEQAPDGADAVDMESEALAEVAATHGVPFMVLRLISDSREKPLPKFLAPFTDAMSATSLRAKLAGTARGARGALTDPAGVARLVKDGSALANQLTAGWRRFSPLI